MWKTVLLGTFAGLFGGALGQPGAETMVPGLLILGIVSDFKTAAGTVLLTMLPPITALAVGSYYSRGQVQVKTAAILFSSFFVAAYFGAYLTKDYLDSTLELVSGIYFSLIGIFFIWNSVTGTYGGKERHSTVVTHTYALKHLHSKH
jgi:uncharacterized membrane protein YfcA